MSQQGIAMNQNFNSRCPKADTCSAVAHVRFGLIADMPGLFDQLIGANEQTQWQLDPNGLGGLRIDE